MKQPKVILYIKSLNPKELSRFDKMMADHKRDTLHSLFKELNSIANNEGKEFDKEKLFKKVFQKKYSADSDYLLRNEMRLLTDELHDFMLNETQNRELEKKDAFRHATELKMLFERKLFDEFDEKIEPYYSEAITQHEYTWAIEMGRLLFLRNVDFNKHDNLGQLKKTEEVIREKIMDCIWKDALRKYRNFQSQLAFTFSRIRNIQPGAVMNFPLFEDSVFDLTSAETPLSRMHFNSGQYFFETDNERKIFYVEQVIENLKQLTDVRNSEGEKVLEPEMDKWQMHAGNIFSRLRRFKEAHVYFDKLAERMSEMPATLSDAIFLNNYSNSFFNLGRFEECIALLEKHKDFLVRHEIVRKLTLNRLTSAYALNHQPEKVREYIPVSFTELDEEEYFFYRSMQSIVFYLEGEISQALREAENLVASMRNRNADEPIRKVWSFCVRYFEILQKYGVFENKLLQHRNKLIMQIEKSSITLNENSAFHFILNWVKTEIRRKPETNKSAD